MKKKKEVRIAFFDTKPYDRKFFDAANRSFDFSLTYFEARLTPDTARMATGFDAVCAFVNDDLGKATVDVLVEEKIKIIAMRCAGYNNVDLKAADDRIAVVRVPGYSPYAVAEYAMAMFMTLNRSLHRAYNRVRESNFSIDGLMGMDVHGKTFGVIGTGKIGGIFAKIVKGCEARVLAYDMYPNQKLVDELGVEYVTLEELYKQSDVISLHCPLTSDNVHMINDFAISLMKPGVFIINTSRGKLIDTTALIDGLKTRQVGGACLDVYEEEGDYFFEDRSNVPLIDDVLARLLTFPNVLVTSHQAFFTREAVSNIASTTLQNLKDYLIEDKLTNGICDKCDKH